MRCRVLCVQKRCVSWVCAIQIVSGLYILPNASESSLRCGVMKNNVIRFPCLGRCIFLPVAYACEKPYCNYNEVAGFIQRNCLRLRPTGFVGLEVSRGTLFLLLLEVRK